MAKIKIDKYDYLRVMLTETLPYEVPITFLNEGMYFYLKTLDKRDARISNEKKSVDAFISIFFEYKDYTKPYNYRITKNSKSKRLLSVPHPAIQKRITNFYQEYDSLITELCSKSPISLRAPFQVASRYYEKELVDKNNNDVIGRVEEVLTEKEGFEKTSIFASSYFTYKKYNFLYKFYDSYESHRIEKKFDFLTRFDISKCFHNIYIPTLAWAVKTKDFSKKYDASYSFEWNFQNIMKFSNDFESSGIIVGPEFSRIFAEIILQDIDLNIIKRLKNELKVNYGNDYTIKRYVDDYFLYTRNQQLPHLALEIIKDELEKYKLYINESKTEFLEVPFITGLTIAKMDCFSLVKDMFNSYEKECLNDEGLKFFINNPGSEANKFIKNLKRIVKLNSVSYESLSGYTLSEIRKKLFKILDQIKIDETIFENNIDAFQKIILMVIEISFFVYSMDIRVRTTYIITQLIVRLNEITNIENLEFKDEIRKKIYDESNLLLSKMLVKGKANSIETLNLLIGIRTNFNDYPINKTKLLELFNLERNAFGEIVFSSRCKKIGYFQIMVLIGFLRKEDEGLTLFIENYIYNLLKDSEVIENNTELTCMFFDSLSCPYFSEGFKVRIIKLILEKVSSEHDYNLNELLDFISSREWFFTWNDSNLAQVLMKKELRSPY